MKTRTLLGPLERANFDHWIILALSKRSTECMSSSNLLRKETDPVSETVFSSFQNSEQRTKSRTRQFRVSYTIVTGGTLRLRYRVQPLNAM
jgi:hypothetical protein